MNLKWGNSYETLPSEHKRKRVVGEKSNSWEGKIW